MPPQLRIRLGDASGQKWVDDNHDLKEDLKRANNGVMPYTPAFTTSDFPGSDQWSEDNPPAILFYLKLPSNPSQLGQTVNHLLDSNGQEIHNLKGNPIRDFPGLPRRISIDAKGWEIEAWRRLDSRITYQDIVDRMTVDLGNAQQFTNHIPKLPSRNSLQNHCRRNCRKILNSYTDYHRREEPHRVELTALEQLNASNIINNTVLKVYHHATGDRLIKVRFTRKIAGGVISVEPLHVTPTNYTTTTYPINFFTQAFSTPFALTESMLKAIDLLFILQERAYLHGHDDRNWTKLGRTCLPVSWFDRTKEKTKEQPSYDGGCNICTWKDPRIYPNGVPPRPVVRRRAVAVSAGDSDSDDESEASASNTQPAQSVQTSSNGVYSPRRTLLERFLDSRVPGQHQQTNNISVAAPTPPPVSAMSSWVYPQLDYNFGAMQYAPQHTGIINFSTPAVQVPV